MQVSVVVTTYNYAHFLPACLESLLAQNLAEDEFEIIVVDDHSSDNTSEVMRSYQHLPAVRYLRNTKNLGCAASANRGIMAARGSFVVRVDADDLVAPSFLQDLHKGLQDRPDVIGCACDYQLFGHGLSPVSCSAQRFPIACGVMFPKSFLLQWGGYHEGFRHLEHEELRLRLGPAYRVAHIARVLYFYRRHTSNQTLNCEARRPYLAQLSKLTGLQPV